jgi:HlyD family secretion protein
MPKWIWISHSADWLDKIIDKFFYFNTKTFFTMTLKIFRIGLFLALLGLGLWLFACGNKETAAVEASGIIETTDVNISSKAVGTILKLNAREGSVVKTGDTLAVIDDADLQLQAAQLKAGVELAKAQLDLLVNGSRSEDIAQADEGMRQAKSNLDNATDDLARYKDLYKSGSVAEKTYQDIQTKYDVSLRVYNATKFNYEKLKRGSRIEDIDAAKARLVQAQAQLASTTKKISDCSLISPVSGIVTKRGVEAGEYVNIGSAMLTISQTQTVKLKIYVAEDELGKVKIGQAAELKIDTYKDKRYQGKVTYISPTAEFTPKNVQTKDDRIKLVFEVQIEADNTSNDLKSGITAEARLISNDAKK